jgi:hypothetical protein
MTNAKQILDSENAKVNFMKGIINLAKVEGIDESDIVLFDKAMMGLGLSEEVIEALDQLIQDEDNIVEIEFESKRQALFFLKEGIQLCYVDGHYGLEEKRLIEEKAAKLGVSVESVKKIEAWVLEGIEWSNKGDQLLELEV